MSTARTHLDDQFLTAIDTLEDAEPGDFVIFSDRRKAALEVVDVETEGDTRTLHLEGARGGEYAIEEDYNPDGSPAFSTDTNETANDLRPATDEQIASHLEMAGLTGGQSVGDLRREGPPEGEPWPGPPDGVDPVDGDEYVSELTSDPGADFASFLSESDIPEASNFDDSLIRELLPDDPDESWTFIDELLATGREVPRTVDNWHLVDYGVVTDDSLGLSRQAAWFNPETNSLVGLGGVRQEGDTQWFVDHASDLDDMTEDERGPALSTDDLGEAFADVLDRIGFDETADIVVLENPDTEEVTVYDALSNTALVRKMVAAKSADPYGIRAYVSTASVPKVIADLDGALVSLYERAHEAGSAVRDRYRAFAEGANLPPTEQIRNLISGQSFNQLGRYIRLTLVSAASGVKRAYTDVRVYPVIEYDALGVDVQAVYTAGQTPKKRFAIDPRRLTEEEDTGAVRIDSFIDTLLPAGLTYVHLVHLAEWAPVDNWGFEVPTPWSGSKTNFFFGKPGRKTSTTVPTSTSSLSDLPAEEKGGADGVTLTRTFALDEEAVDNLLSQYGGDRPKQRFIVYLAALNRADERGLEVEDVSAEDFPGEMGPNVGNFRSVYEDHGLNKQNVSYYDVYRDALTRMQVSGKPTHIALSEAIRDEDPPVDIATGSDFDDRAFTDSTSGIRQEGGSSQTPTGSLTEDELDEAKEIVSELERNMMLPEDLRPEQRELLRRAEDEAGIVPEEYGTVLDVLEAGGTPTRGSPESAGEVPEDATAEDLIKLGREQGWLDKTAEMDPEDRADEAERMAGEEMRPTEERDIGQ